LIIHPDECIDCGACVDECPVSAILPDDAVQGSSEEESIETNKAWFEMHSEAEIEAARQTVR
jgi:ferredoxin